LIFFTQEIKRNKSNRGNQTMARGGYRSGAGRPKGAKNKKAAATKGPPKQPKAPKQPEVPADIQDEAKAANLTPLEYMLKVMNDEGEKDKTRRDRMAIAAAPFVHPRKGEGAGKKEERDGKAKAAGSGKFASGAPPKLAVVKK
jgi:phage terminase small subunit